MTRPENISARIRLLKLNRYPLKILYILGLCLIFLPLITGTIISIGTLQQVTRVSDEIIEKSFAEMHHTMLLQLYIAQAAMPPNDHLIHAGPDEQLNARLKNEAVEQVLSNIFALDTWLPDQLEILNEAKREWLVAKPLGETILRIRNPLLTDQNIELMERYDAHIDRAVESLERLNRITSLKAEKDYEKLHKLKTETADTMIITVSIVMLLAILGGVVMIRSVFPALKQIEQGIGAYGLGRLEYRINSDMPVELSRVANGLNDMAAQLQETYTELEKKSLQDGLTGAYNKRKFSIDFQNEIDRAKRYNQSLSLLFIDLDHFKLVNDTYGHPAGDVVLRKAVEQMDLQLRSSDALYRYGGEEFAIILPETGESVALVVAERIRSSMAENPILINGHVEVVVTVSIGIAIFPRHGVGEKDLILAADAAVYAAKRGGRNLAILSV